MNDPWRVEECLQRLKAASEVGFDVETSGLDWIKHFVCGYVFTFGPNEGDTYYLPVRHKGGGNIPGGRIPQHETDYDRSKDIHPLEIRLAEIINNTPRTWYAHHSKFDLHMAANHGIWLYGNIEDTEVAQALINENQGHYDLDTCCLEMDVKPKVSAVYEYISNYLQATESLKVEPKRKATMGHFWKTPAWADGEPTTATIYAMGDGSSMHDLRIKQLARIKAEELDLVWNVEKRVTRTLFRMERRGIPVSVGMLQRVSREVDKELERAIKLLPDGFNVRSPPQVAKLYLDMGYSDEQFVYTPSGNKSCTEAWLESQPLGPEIIKVRKLRNLNSTFIESAIRSNLTDVSGSWRVHCNYNQLKLDDYGTVSGRLSCDHPNLQQIPKRDKILAPLLRQLFRSALSGVLWWSADYSQQEYRVFADFSGAKMVLDMYAKDPDADYHQFVAEMLGVQRDPDAKQINLGIIYNMGVRKLAVKLGVPISVAKSYMNRLQRLMPEARQFNRIAEGIAKRRGYVKTLLGRRRRFPNPNIAHKAGNGVIQGSSADITKLKMAEIDEHLMGDPMQLNPALSVHKSQLILQVHDSLDFEYVEEERAVMEECMRIMEAFGPDDVISLTVPMKADVNQGVSWGHATWPKYTEWLEAA